MAENNTLFVCGYHFLTDEDADLARSEQKKIAFFSEKLKGRNAESILAIYDKIIDDKLLQTPVGWEYLRQLQQRMIEEDISADLIRPLPMYMSFSHRESETVAKQVRQRIRPSQKSTLKAKRNFRISILVNILLGILVIAMFAITLNSSNPNILNYKKCLENQYASWEQELTQREELIREKENEISQK